MATRLGLFLVNDTNEYQRLVLADAEAVGAGVGWVLLNRRAGHP